MKRVFVVNVKGGVGKTTIANEIAYSLDRTNTPYSFFNLDPQGGSPHDTKTNDDELLQLADTPGHPTEKDLERYIRAADVLVIPVRSSTLDAHSFMHTVNTAKELNPAASIIVVQNGWNRWNAAKQFLVWLREQIGADIPIYPLCQSDMIVQAQAAGVSAVDKVPKKKVAEQVKALANAVRKAAGVEEEV